MQRKPDFNLLTAVAVAIFLVCATASVNGIADTQSRRDADRALLQRIYQMRMQYDQERAQKENEARANVRLVTQSNGAAADSPTVTQLRQQTNAELAHFETQFRCLDVDVENGGGNTVVICGDNSGDIEGTNVHAERDIVTIPGGTP
ncbi:MAG: hypothetical protein PVH91_14655 [Pseudomonadales bacterium]|jgi:hypothetical protein